MSSTKTPLPMTHPQGLKPETYDTFGFGDLLFGGQ